MSTSPPQTFVPSLSTPHNRRLKRRHAHTHTHTHTHMHTHTHAHTNTHTHTHTYTHTQTHLDQVVDDEDLFSLGVPVLHRDGPLLPVAHLFLVLNSFLNISCCCCCCCFFWLGGWLVGWSVGRSRWLVSGKGVYMGGCGCEEYGSLSPSNRPPPFPPQLSHTNNTTPHINDNQQNQPAQRHNPQNHQTPQDSFVPTPHQNPNAERAPQTPSPQHLKHTQNARTFPQMTTSRFRLWNMCPKRLAAPSSGKATASMPAFRISSSSTGTVVYCGVGLEGDGCGE
jgi:hypothetical protein